MDAAYAPDRLPARSGQGAYMGPDADQGTIDAVVLGGATDVGSAELNPRYGMDDPGLVRNSETGEKAPTPEEG